MKVTKKQLEQLVREAVEAEVGQLNEEELDELLGGLKNVFGAGAKAVGGAAQKAGQAVQGVAQKAAGAVQQAGQKVAGATQGAVQGAVGAVKNAYQSGEKQAAMNSVKQGLQKVVGTVDQALQKVGNDPNAQHDLENVKAAVSSAATALAEGRRVKVTFKHRSSSSKK